MTAPIYSPAELLEKIPPMFAALRELDSREPVDLVATVRASGLEPTDDRAHRPWTEWAKLPALGFAVTDDADEVFEKRVKTAITKLIGRPAGTAKEWDLGNHVAAIGSSQRPGARRLIVHLRPQYSLRELQRAAADFLAGVDVEEWISRHGYGDRELPRSAYVHRTPGRTAVNLHMPAAARPPATRPASDDENLELTLAYLAEALGESSTPGLWIHGDRSFRFRRMRSRSRSIEFLEQMSSPPDA